MRLKRVMILMLSFLMLLGCNTQRSSSILSDRTFTKIEFEVFGKKVEPYQYVLEKNIDNVQKIIDDIYVEDNYLGVKEDIELPKGITYQLTFIEEDLKEIECMLSHEYFVINEEVYKVNDYNKTIKDIENLFDVKYD